MNDSDIDPQIDIMETYPDTETHSEFNKENKFSYSGQENKQQLQQSIDTTIKSDDSVDEAVIEELVILAAEM